MCPRRPTTASRRRSRIAWPPAPLGSRALAAKVPAGRFARGLVPDHRLAPLTDRVQVANPGEQIVRGYDIRSIRPAGHRRHRPPQLGRQDCRVARRRGAGRAADVNARSSSERAPCPRAEAAARQYASSDSSSRPRSRRMFPLTRWISGIKCRTRPFSARRCPSPLASIASSDRPARCRASLIMLVVEPSCDAEPRLAEQGTPFQHLRHPGLDLSEPYAGSSPVHACSGHPHGEAFRPRQIVDLIGNCESARPVPIPIG